MTVSILSSFPNCFNVVSPITDQKTGTDVTSVVSEESPLLSPAWLAKLERMELVSRKIFRGRMKGERRSSRKGQSVEFADFRNYVPGDDLRFIDWNLFARMDRLYLKLFLEEEDLHISMVIDDSASMNFGAPTKLRIAKQIAASLGYIGLCRGDRVAISSFNRSQPVVLRNRSSSLRLIKSLDAMQPAESNRVNVRTEKTNEKTMSRLNDCLKTFCLKIGGKGIAIVISDLMDKHGYETGLKTLLAKELDIFVIHILSPDEIDPTYVGDLQLIDVEDGEKREISVSSSLLQRYKRTVEGYIAKARDFCQRRGIAYVMVRSDQPIETLVEQYLRVRGLVR